MPLLHQDTSRGGGGSTSNRHSMADFLGFEPPRHDMPDEPIIRDNASCDDWRWEEPGSPQAAHTPRSLVPPACFPPRHPTAFASFSESARPGSGWSDDNSGQGITDLVTSLKTLAIPTARSPRTQYDDINQVESAWSSEQQSTVSRNDRNLPRRASFCGVVPNGRNGCNGALSWNGALRWSGALPARGADPGGGYSPKVFLGGLPWDISEQALLHALRQFQPIRVEWPGREVGAGAGGGGGGGGPRGYAYVTFESERRVRALLAASRTDGGDWYYRIASRKMRSKEVQVIPWAVSDASWVRGGSARLEPQRTVFVGALHGMLSAQALAAIMNDLFEGVVYAGIDTDKNKYPIGSGRVTFSNVRSYVRAVSAAYVEIRTDKFTKKVQVDPYLEDSMCSVCNVHQGPYFCREPTCFRYFCRACWAWQHPADEHKPLMRSSKSAGPHSLNGPMNGPMIGPHNGHGPMNGAHNNGLSNGQRLTPPSDHSSLYNGSYHGPSEGTNSPSTSGASGASELEAPTDDPADCVWPPPPR